MNIREQAESYQAALEKAGLSREDALKKSGLDKLPKIPHVPIPSGFTPEA